MIKGTIEGARVNAHVWTEIEGIEEQAKEQIKNIASLPFVFHHVAVMPDVHYGKGATVGSVIATKGAISPAAVGVDIGCGMQAMKTNLGAHWFDTQTLKRLRYRIEERIPVGFAKNHGDNISGVSGDLLNRFDSPYGDNDLLNNANKQIGTLGGGNHFIELCLDELNNMWVVLHSGSRNIGKVLAERHINEAKALMEKNFIDLPDKDLAYLVSTSFEFQRYITDVLWCQEYARQNRNEMMSRIRQILIDEFNYFIMEPVIDCHHNYISLENHFGQNVYVTRKGAVRARKGDKGIIPGSMGTKSYIVSGLGNEMSFNSCSHGAGRRMSRGEARRTFTQEDLRAQTAGVECRKDEEVIDEIPGAYKDIDQVMENQSDLVSIDHTLKQILCVKG